MMFHYIRYTIWLTVFIEPKWAKNSFQLGEHGEGEGEGGELPLPLLLIGPLWPRFYSRKPPFLFFWSLSPKTDHGNVIRTVQCSIYLLVLTPSHPFQNHQGLFSIIRYQLLEYSLSITPELSRYVQHIVGNTHCADQFFTLHTNNDKVSSSLVA